MIPTRTVVRLRMRLINQRILTRIAEGVGLNEVIKTAGELVKVLAFKGGSRRSAMRKSRFETISLGSG